MVTPGGMVNVTCGTERENGSINYRISLTAIDDQWHYPGHQPIHTDVGANCIRGLCAPLRAGHARTGLANPATGPNTATVALATFVAFKAVGSATCQQRSRRGAFEEQLTGIGCTHSRGWLNQVKEHGRTGRDCSAARGGSTAAQYRCSAQNILCDQEQGGQDQHVCGTPPTNEPGYEFRCHQQRDGPLVIRLVTRFQ